MDALNEALGAAADRGDWTETTGILKAEIERLNALLDGHLARIMAQGVRQGDLEADLERLRTAISKEIGWHNVEAGFHRDARSESADAGNFEEAVIHKYEARRHETAALRLHAILYPATEKESAE